MKNSRRKYFVSTDTVRKLALKCARGDRINKLVKVRTRQLLRKKQHIQKIGCRVIATIAAIDKDNTESK